MTYWPKPGRAALQRRVRNAKINAGFSPGLRFPGKEFFSALLSRTAPPRNNYVIPNHAEGAVRNLLFPPQPLDNFCSAVTPLLIIFSSMPDFSIGVDLGGTNLRIAAISTDGQLVEKINVTTKTALGPGHVVTEMCDAILHLCAKHKSAGNFLGAGIGFPGLIDMQTGVMRKSANLPGFEDYPVRAEIERRLEAPVVLENDGRVAALGEQWLGAARGVQNVAVITLGTGIGSGIILGGKIWHGMNGMAGEFGHVTVEPEGVPCGCGNRGCAERYASASALLRMAREAIAAGHAPALAQAAASPDFGAQSIYNLATTQDDEPSRRIFHTFGRYLGMMLAGAVNVLNLEMYVLGGGVAVAWDAYAPAMFHELRQRSIVYASTAPTEQSSAGLTQAQREEGKTIINRAQLGSDAGLYGAAHAAGLAS
jgi:glucokinase